MPTHPRHSSRAPRCRRRRAFSVTELVVLVPVLAVLLLGLLLAVDSGRRTARDVLCRSHLSRLGIAAGCYANSHQGSLFINRASPYQISNVVYKHHRSTGWGLLYPRYLGNYHTLFCPEDPGRGPAWEYGWSNWGAKPDPEPPDDDRGQRGRKRGWRDPQPAHGSDHSGHRGGDHPRKRGWHDPQPTHGSDRRGHGAGRRGRGHDRGRRRRSEVQCSYGYRGRQGLVPPGSATFTVSALERAPQKILGCDFYEPFFAPPRIHHRNHINVLRCNGQVEQVNRLVSFGPTVDDIADALAVLDR